MRIIKVSNLVKTNRDGVFDCDVTFKKALLSRPETHPFTYNPGDAEEMSVLVGKWLQAKNVNPSRQAAAYVPQMPTKALINMEALRRIRAAGYTDKKQLSILMNGTDEERQVMAETIKRIVDRSNVLVDHPVLDYENDTYWS